MKRFALPLLITLTLSACAYFQKDPDAGDPVVDKTTARSVHDVIECLTVEASKRGASFRTTPLPQGSMLDFGDSNVIKVRADNGGTTYRFYAGKRHVSNLWLENADKSCAP
ncbi:hypothetical protein [Paraburkholderia caballeronis]|uniref:Lipoprotein n=1 Tax=Paraburkholderia caballeronis TaxID=416943 RepID=A0A1H7QGM4_9BURK|nr:hypothetical protein [Paraburkholderia caballeronis]PXW22561.1 hypothetical protein C7403_114137 [Paraburkholderia caballeronis]PXW96432.1 hypothetical protein C7407_114137 [Paraburkholderia caballeronis]RAJ92843.1 hypothetical protein C7409_114137 [Paraburkholderia caballeronis]TDV34370.1 hypothetical protein C7405_108101 [Paraburkholderia caballeronis]SEE06574.1 hypothetical protein SAMN05445871_4588 [Paraburkholderia caballeronis]